LVEKNVKTKPGKENSYQNKFYINIKICTEPLVIKKKCIKRKVTVGKKRNEKLKYIEINK
jgi:hypothetical protein